MVKATIFEAKTNLSALVRKAQSGETVILTSGRERTPVARLEAVATVEKKRLGVRLTQGFVLPDSFFDPLPEDELRLWDGEGE
jgi:antitoxin (DNA-binding transcriptional repressor) of toxin-antitoxin stability system